MWQVRVDGLVGRGRDGRVVLGVLVILRDWADAATEAVSSGSYDVRRYSHHTEVSNHLRTEELPADVSAM